MIRSLLLGDLALAATLLLGAWLVASPFALQTQPAGHAWQTATIVDVAAGGALVVASALVLLVVQALWLRDLVAAARVGHADRDQAEMAE
jgi:hypothetical protein